MIPVPTRRAVIDVGHQCDINCLHCYHRFETNKGFRGVGEIMRDIECAKDRGNTYIDFTGGEPTLHPDILNLVKYVNELEMKCCIITNGLQYSSSINEGSDILKDLIENVDDWLISTHGNETDHNKIVGFDRARVQQEMFINLLEKQKRTYRFNCCILSYNQYNIVEFAQWAAQKEWLRIVNFINFNPHGVWSGHPEALSRMADLNVVEEQLNKAIATLEQAGKGINVRYYPMCRLAPENRKYICNDLQVMFDPYEWDYGIVPKTFEAYTCHGHIISGANEWKAAPCIGCNIRGVCGGINANFYRTYGDKSIIHEITDVERTRDVYHYRRHNTVALQDRNPLNDFCIAVIADENMAAYAPLFIYAAHMNQPDLKIMVFARYSNHNTYREIVDGLLGVGFYDSVVIDIHSGMVGYPEHPFATATLRFVEFEKELSVYKSVLWTDIDMLLGSDKGIKKQHLDTLLAIKTLSGIDEYCYENNPILPEGNDFRLSGVHFITQKWWDATREARTAAAEKLMKTTVFPKHFDEVQLYTIVKDAGLPLMEKQVIDPRLRHHGVHLGDWRYGKNNNLIAHVDEAIETQVRKLLADTGFEAVFHACGEINPVIRHIELQWNTTYLRNPVGTLIPQYQKQVESLTLGKKVKPKFNKIHHEGSLAIVVACDINYAPFAPLFVHSALSLLKTHPGMKVFVVGVRNSEGEENELMQFLEGIKNEYKGFADVILYNPLLAKGGFFTAATRFITAFPEIKQFDYALITDIDIMLMPETETIIDSHMMHMDRDGTECYENWISETRGTAPRLPGIHFVTKQWWDRTSDARTAAYDDLKSRKEIEYCHDEYMLGKIVVDSGLSLPPKAAKLWRKHGVHIGDLRIDANRKTLYQPNVWEFEHIKSLINDPVFMAKWKKAEAHIPYLEKIMKMWVKTVNA